jgi:hypothetical protein
VEKSESQLTVDHIIEQRNNALNMVAALSARLELAEKEIARLKGEPSPPL